MSVCSVKSGSGSGKKPSKLYETNCSGADDSPEVEHTYMNMSPNPELESPQIYGEQTFLIHRTEKAN